MASNNYHPIPALLGQFDARAFADNTTLFSRGATNISLTTASAVVYEDALAFLNGYGSPANADMTAAAQTLWTAAGAAGLITIGMSIDDKVYVQSDTDDFTIAASADNAVFGADVAGYGLVGGVAPFRRTFTGEWQRGCIQDAQLTIDPAGAPAAFAVPAANNKIQSVITAMRATAHGDADDVSATPSLQTRDNSAAYRWGINDTGYVFTSRPAGVGAAISAWANTTFRDRLGFTGSEVEVSSGASVVLTAARRMPGVYVPTRPLETIERRTIETGSTAVLTSGDVAANHVSSVAGWRAVYFVDGPADSSDSSRHWVERCVRDYWRRGSGLTLYQQWGDPRRTRATHEITATDVAYSLLYTSEFDGYRGRLRCRIDPESPEVRTLTWPTRLRGRVPVDILLRDRV